MYKKIIQILLSVSLLVLPISNASDTPIETADEKNIEIIDTVRIKPAFSHDSVINFLKEEVRYTKNWSENGEDTTINISRADAERLLKLAYAEGGSEGIQGQLYIMQCVWNRVQSDDFPDSIRGVIEQPNAFASVSLGTYYVASPTWETHMALSIFEQNKDYDPAPIGFETNDNGSALLKYFDFYKKYRNHTFYKLKKD